MKSFLRKNRVDRPTGFWAIFEATTEVGASGGNETSCLGRDAPPGLVSYKRYPSEAEVSYLLYISWIFCPGSQGIHTHIGKISHHPTQNLDNHFMFPYNSCYADRRAFTEFVHSFDIPLSSYF